ncbi:glycosyltransferase [Candidatus Amarolinea aalborgensis]|uniref:glycosyltransferase n=1 Tax=Candidatus Amarolinea aalborgensis TaxID=2249329 RepID=UPI003BF986A6
MGSFWTYHQFSIAVFAACLVLIALSNWRLLRRVEGGAPPAQWPRVSVLVPARNEEINIGDCVRSLLTQNCPDLEVIVLDDQSCDRTGEILAELASQDRRLRVLAGQALPDGWLGKHWACQQLAESATGDLLFFTDADTRHEPQSLRHGVVALMTEQADLLTACPRLEVVTWAEKLVIPFFPWGVLSFLPLALAYRVRASALCAANGQYMLFRRAAYDQIGGYAAVRADAVDDIALARQIKAHGLSWRMALATQDVRCRMYRNSAQVFEGFTKNLFAGFGYRVLPFLLIWLWICIVFLQPPIVLALIAAGLLHSTYSVVMAAVGVFLAVLLWGISNARFGFPLYLALLYPVTTVLTLFIAARSVAFAVRGRSTWKGRTMVQARIRWW